jgi:hypothetical protein
MIGNNTAVIVYVTCQGTPETRFDRDYYIAHHLPLVMLCAAGWRKRWIRRGRPRLVGDGRVHHQGRKPVETCDQVGRQEFGAPLSSPA